MDWPNKQQLFDYYNERAPEYEEFYDGVTSRKLFAPALIRREVDNLKKLMQYYVNGRCIDIACGTGFWLPIYERNCDSITLIDQSKNTLSECAKKVERLGIEHKTEMLCDDIFNYPYAAQAYDSAIIAFLISHLTDDEVDTLITALKKLLAPGGRFVFMDNAWNEVIANIPRTKTSMVNRTLKNGRQFRILKRYFERHDLEDIARRNEFNLDIVCWEELFFFASGCFTRDWGGKATG